MASTRPGSTKEPASKLMSDLLGRPLALRALFTRPRYMESFDGIERAPFMAWLVELLRPTLFVETGSSTALSYFGVCQAAQQLDIPVDCHGFFDFDASRSDGRKIEDMKEYSDLYYYENSHIYDLKDHKDSSEFADGSVDLLHIDIERPIESVSKDFQDWLPKLSARAVVLLLGAVRPKLPPQIVAMCDAYPRRVDLSAEQGLTMLGVGERQVDLLGRLFEAEKDTAQRGMTRDFFTRFGRACRDASSIVEEKRRASEFRDAFEVQAHNAGLVNEELNKTRSELKIRTSELSDVRAMMERAAQHYAAERGQLSERIATAQQWRDELKANLDKAIQSLEAERAKNGEFIASLHGAEMARLELEIEIKDLKQSVATLNLAVEAEKNAAAEARAETQKVVREADGIKARTVKLQTDLGRAESEIEVARAQASKFQEDLGHARSQAEATKAQIAKLQADLVQTKGEADTAKAQAAKLQADLAQTKGEADTAKAQAAKLQADLAQTKGEADTAKAQAAKLQTDLAQTKGEADTAKAQAAKLQTELAQARNEADTAKAQAAKLQTELAQARDEAEAAKARAAKFEEDLARVEDEAQAANAQAAELREALARAEGEAQAANAQAAELREALARAEGEAQAANTQAAELREALARVEGEAQAANAQAAELREALARAEDETQAARAQAAELQEALARAEDETQAAKTHAAELREALARAESEADAAKTENGSLLELLASAEDEAKAAKAETIALQEALAGAEAETDAAKAENATLQEALARVEGEADAAKAENATLQEDLARAEGEAEAAKALTVELRADLEQAARDHEVDRAAALQSALGNISGLRHALDEFTDENAQLRDRLSEMAAEARQLRDAQAAREVVLADYVAKLEARTIELGKMTHLQAQERLRFEERHAAAMAAFNRVVSSLVQPAAARDDTDELIRCGQCLIDAGLFDPETYLQLNPDVATAGMNPVLHYLKFGNAEGRQTIRTE